MEEQVIKMFEDLNNDAINLLQEQQFLLMVEFQFNN